MKKNSTKRLQRLRASIAMIENPPQENEFKAVRRKQALLAHIRKLTLVAATINVGGRP